MLLSGYARQPQSKKLFSYFSRYFLKKNNVYKKKNSLSVVTHDPLKKCVAVSLFTETLASACFFLIFLNISFSQ